VQQRKTRPARTMKQRAIALLARREYARAELASRLLAAGATRDELEPVLDELERAGYLSDARFAVGVVRQKVGAYSRRAIAHALREKGVAPTAAREALAQLDDTDELAQAMALWQRRFGTPPVDERDKARQLRFLLSRGFSQGIAFKVLKAAGTRADFA
jgi:regulatory protein